MLSLPPFLAGDSDRISTLYTAPLTFFLFVPLLFILRHRAAKLRHPAHTAPELSGQAPSLLGRLPHVVCCLLLSAQPIVIIANDATLVDQDVLPFTATDPASLQSARAATRGLYVACSACEAVMWALCATLVVAEQRHGKHSCRSLRFWWIAHLAVAIARVTAEIVRIVFVARECASAVLALALAAGTRRVPPRRAH